jgi:hypothetical protein
MNVHALSSDPPRQAPAADRDLRELVAEAEAHARAGRTATLTFELAADGRVAVHAEVV